MAEWSRGVPLGQDTPAEEHTAGAEQTAVAEAEHTAGEEPPVPQPSGQAQRSAGSCHPWACPVRGRETIQLRGKILCMPSLSFLPSMSFCTRRIPQANIAFSTRGWRKIAPRRWRLGTMPSALDSMCGMPNEQACSAATRRQVVVVVWGAAWTASDYTSRFSLSNASGRGAHHVSSQERHQARAGNGRGHLGICPRPVWSLFHHEGIHR